MTLTQHLETIVARATAVTMGKDTATDTEALYAELNPLWAQMGDHAAELRPVVARLTQRLTAELAKAPAAVQATLAQYRRDTAEAKFDRIDTPREVIAFLVLDGLERIGEFLATQS